MANDKDNGNSGLPVNFERIGAGKVETMPDILNRGSEGNTGGNKWELFLKNKDGKLNPNEPISELTEPEKDTKEKEDHEKDAKNQQPNHEKDEPEKD